MTEIPTGPPGTIRFRNHVERARPRRRRKVKVEKLHLGEGQLPRIHMTGFDKNWRTRDFG